MSKNEPRLRFPGFTEEWEKKKLGDLGSVLMCRRIYENQTKDKNEVPFFKIGTFGKTPDAFISESLFNEYKEKYPYPQKGDILISAAGTIGRVVEYDGSDSYYQDSNIVWMNLKNNLLLNNYLKFIYQTLKWDKLEGGTIKRLYNKDLLNIPINLPEPLEQTKIANFLSTLDSRISLQSQKVEKLEKLKKGYMQKIFSQELRFKREDGSEYGEWEDKKLGEIVSIKTGKLDANAMREDGKYAFFTCSKENYKTDTFAFEGEALLIAGNGDIGVVKYYDGKFNAYQRTYVVQNSKENIKFLKFMVEYFLPKQIYDNTLGSAMPYITLSVLTDMIITNPFPEEQTKIADFLSTFDKQIELEKKELEKLQELKKGLLQQMFV